MLYAHNQVVFDDLCDALKTHNKVMVLACTGHGKTYIIKELLEKTEQKALVICTGKEIKENWESLTDQIDAVTYSGFSHMENPPAYPMVIIDEAHHTGARVWGAKIAEYMAQHPETKFIGLTADAKRYSDGGRDMTDELFDGNAVYGLTLSEAIAQGVLPPFKYVCAWIQVESKVKELREKLNGYSGNKAILDKLISKLQYTAENTDNISRILSENMPTGKRKGIIFVDSITNIEEGVKIAQDNFSSPVWAIHSKQSDFVNQENRNAFDGAKKGWLVTVNKVNEGLHLNAVNTIIMLRRTQSPTVFFQQLGRAMSIDNFGKDVVVFDFVGNHRTLKTIAVETGEFLGLGERQEADNGKIVQVIIDSYTQEALDLLESIEDGLSDGWTSDEDYYLIEHYKIDGAQKCADNLKRTKQAVLNRVSKLGISKQNASKWTAQEEAYLIEHYSEDGTKKCAEALGRSISAVLKKARKLKLKSNCFWSTKDDEYLIKHFHTKGPAECARNLGHTSNAVKRRASALGLLQKSKEWTPKEDAYLAKHYKTDGSKKCAEALERTEDAVKARFCNLGLHNQKHWWTAKEKEYLVKQYQHDGAKKCAEALGRTASAVMSKAGEMGLTGKTTGKWTPPEEEYLIEHYQADGAQKCSEALGYTKVSIYGKAKALGIVKKQKQHITWTLKDEEYLMKHYRADGAQKCAETLGRTKDAIVRRANVLGISNQTAPNWTPAEENYLIEFYQTDGALKCAETLGRSANAVRLRAVKLGLSQT